MGNYDPNKHPKDRHGRWTDKPKVGADIPRAAASAGDPTLPEWCDVPDDGVRDLLTKPSGRLTPEERNTLLDVTYASLEDGHWEEHDDTDTVENVRDMVGMYAKTGHAGSFDKMYVGNHVDWESTLSPDSLAALHGQDDPFDPLDEFDGFIGQYGSFDMLPDAEPPAPKERPSIDAVVRMADLSGKDLSLMDLSGRLMSHADLEGADLHGANLRDADLRWADLTGANLEGADLTGANLERATVRKADLQGANLTGTSMQGADLKHANLENTNLKGTCLLDARLSGADIRGAAMDGTDLGGADMRNAVLDETFMDGVLLNRANLSNVDLTYVEFRGKPTNLSYAILDGATVTPEIRDQAWLESAHCEGINVKIKRDGEEW